MPQKTRHLLKNPGDLSVKLREPSESTGHRRKSFQLIFRLQKIDMGALRSAQVLRVGEHFAESDAKNGHIALPQFLVRLIQGMF